MGEFFVEEFCNIYRKFFLYGNVEKFVEYVFWVFDENWDGKLDFWEFICVVGIIFWGILEIKVKFVFRIYDLDKDGYIIEYEMTEILKVNLERENIV